MVDGSDGDFGAAPSVREATSANVAEPVARIHRWNERAKSAACAPSQKRPKALTQAFQLACRDANRPLTTPRFASAESVRLNDKTKLVFDAPLVTDSTS